MGTRCLGFKGGIGTSSRTLPAALGGYTVGVLVQTNYGGVLTVDGHRVGERLGRHVYREILQEVLQPKQEPVLPTRNEEGSVMIVVATDAPLGARNLERLARRAVLGLARTGSFMSNGSARPPRPARSSAWRTPAPVPCSWRLWRVSRRPSTIH